MDCVSSALNFPDDIRDIVNGYHVILGLYIASFMPTNVNVSRTRKLYVANGMKHDQKAEYSIGVIDNDQDDGKLEMFA